MTSRQFYDWQTAGDGGEVLLLVEAHPELAARLPADVAQRLRQP